MLELTYTRETGTYQVLELAGLVDRSVTHIRVRVEGSTERDKILHSHMLPSYNANVAVDVDVDTSLTTVASILAERIRSICGFRGDTFSIDLQPFPPPCNVQMYGLHPLHERTNSSLIQGVMKTCTSGIYFCKAHLQGLGFAPLHQLRKRWLSSTVGAGILHTSTFLTSQISSWQNFDAGVQADLP